MTAAAKTHKPDLIEFLAQCGAEILEPTNEWEAARFRSRGQVCVIYNRSKGGHSFSGPEAREAFNAWHNGKPYLAGEKVKRIKRPPQIDALLKRDGSECFFCGHDMPEDDISLEHLVPNAHGGNNHLSNLALAHVECNQQADSLSVVEKVQLREQMRKARTNYGLRLCLTS